MYKDAFVFPEAGKKIDIETAKTVLEAATDKSTAGDQVASWVKEEAKKR